ncbi:MAG: DUF423 domain-containing protein [Flavobacteriales bacterium]
MNKTILGMGIMLGLTAVVLGAFGAHGLEKLVSADNIETFSTGVTYQMYHALFLLILGSMNFIPESSKKSVFYLIVVGVLLFSGSIYTLATNELTAFDFKKIAILTPIGGSLLIFGWILLGIRIFRQRV